MTNKPGSGDPIEGGGVSRVYVNFLSIGHNMSEVLLEFGQFFDQSVTPRFQARLVTSPLHLRSFHELMGDTLERYQDEFGPLPLAEPADREH